jgi:cell division septation protein DedD
MLSILNPRSQAQEEPPSDEPVAAPAQPESEFDFEIVLGKRQVAGVLFVATVILVVFSAASYLAAKALSRKAGEPVSAAPVPAEAVIPETPSPIAPLTQPQTSALAPTEAPIFAEPKKGGVYLQMGAVEKGIAIIFAEGLRKHGLEAFVAPGPNATIFRVLIGPFADHPAYERAKATIDRIGLTTFGRRYEE